MLMKTHGIVQPRLNSSAQMITDVFGQPELGFLKAEESLVATLALEDDLLDESPVSGDPMLSTLNAVQLGACVNGQRNSDIIDLLKMNVSCQ